MPLGNAGIGPGIGNSDPARQLQLMVRSGLSFSGNESHVIFKNEKGKSFKDISSISGLDLKDDGRAVCFSDWDQDGDLDVWISNRNGPQIRYLKNNHGNRNNSLTLKLIGQKCNSDAIGARVILKTDDGLTQTRTINAGSGFLSQSTKFLHFGLGEFDKANELTIYWPGFKPQTITGLSAGHYSIRQELEPAPFQIRSRDTKRASPIRKPDDRTLLAQILPVSSIFELSENDIQKPSLLSLTRDECEKCQNQLEKWNEAPPEGVEIKIQNIDKLKITKPGLLELFQITYDHFFDIFSRAIPTPVSFLIDTNGNLRSIYRGQIRPETLSKDIQMIESGGYDGRNLSLPFPGIWSSESNPSARPLNFVEDLVDAGKISMAEKYISDERENLIKDDVFPMLLKRIESIKKERRP